MLVPEDPVVYVEMNDLNAYLLLVKRLQYYTSIVEIASVRENRNILQYWTNLLMASKKIVEDCANWVNAVEDDIKDDVLRNEKVRDLMRGLALLPI